MRILIGCGGTGGHIYPALTIAQALEETFADVTLLFVGAQGGMEVNLVTAAGYAIQTIPIKGWQRKKIISNIRLLLLVFKSFYRTSKIIRLFKPDLVIGTGGYVALPTLLAACIQRIPTLIQEQNSVAGLTNRLLARFVSKICTAYPAVALPCAKQKVVVTGNPVRPSIYMPQQAQETVLRHFGFVPDKKCLLVVGGSGGADQLNASVLEGLSKLLVWDIQLLWITGKRYYPMVNDCLHTHYRDKGQVIRCYPSLQHMGLAYAAADVVVSRAGALSIAELCILQKPTILVPSPNVVGDHQTKNSLPLVQQGAALLLADYLCPQLLWATVVALLKDQVKQSELVRNMHAFGLLHANALEKIMQEIKKLVCFDSPM